VVGGSGKPWAQCGDGQRRRNAEPEIFSPLRPGGAAAVVRVFMFITGFDVPKKTLQRAAE
jgi:hypothetical protein